MRIEKLVLANDPSVTLSMLVTCLLNVFRPVCHVSFECLSTCLSTCLSRVFIAAAAAILSLPPQRIIAAAAAILSLQLHSSYSDMMLNILDLVDLYTE